MKTLLIGLLCIVMFIIMVTMINPKPVIAQTNSVVGSWRLIAADKILPDGKRVADYGTDPRGIAIFTPDGHYAVEIFRNDRARSAPGDQQGLSCHFGTYSMNSANGTITLNVNGASNPAIDQTSQIRLFRLSGDTLSWRVPPRPDGTIPLSVFKRIQ
jgi:hypothetical protein